MYPMQKQHNNNPHKASKIGNLLWLRSLRAPHAHAIRKDSVSSAQHVNSDFLSIRKGSAFTCQRTLAASSKYALRWWNTCKNENEQLDCAMRTQLSCLYLHCCMCMCCASSIGCVVVDGNVVGPRWYVSLTR